MVVPAMEGQTAQGADAENAKSSSKTEGSSFQQHAPASAAFLERMALKELVREEQEKYESATGKAAVVPPLFDSANPPTANTKPVVPPLFDSNNPPSSIPTSSGLPPTSPLKNTNGFDMYFEKVKTARIDAEEREAQTARPSTADPFSTYFAQTARAAKEEKEEAKSGSQTARPSTGTDPFSSYFAQTARAAEEEQESGQRRSQTARAASDSSDSSFQENAPASAAFLENHALKERNEALKERIRVEEERKALAAKIKALEQRLSGGGVTRMRTTRMRTMMTVMRRIVRRIVRMMRTVRMSFLMSGRRRERRGRRRERRSRYKLRSGRWNGQ
jgi:hypothetical protein